MIDVFIIILAAAYPAYWVTRHRRSIGGMGLGFLAGSAVGLTAAFGVAALWISNAVPIMGEEIASDVASRVFADRVPLILIVALGMAITTYRRAKPPAEKTSL